MSFAMNAAAFQGRWEDWLRAEFASPREIAQAFGVTPQTARNWLDGVAAPRGWVVAAALTRWRSAGALLEGFGE